MEETTPETPKPLETAVTASNTQTPDLQAYWTDRNRRFNYAAETLQEIFYQHVRTLPARVQKEIGLAMSLPPDQMVTKVRRQDGAAGRLLPAVLTEVEHRGYALAFFDGSDLRS